MSAAAITALLLELAWAATPLSNILLSKACNGPSSSWSKSEKRPKQKPTAWRWRPLEQDRQAKAAQEAEQKRKADEQERQAKAAQEAEQKRRADEAEQQRLAAVKAEQDRQAKAAQEAEQKRKADEAQQQRLAAIKAEQERQAKVAQEAAEQQQRSNGFPINNSRFSAGATLIGSYGDWRAYFADKDGRVCFAITRSSSQSFLFISTRPAKNVLNEVSLMIGYDFKPSTDATVEIGPFKFALYTQKDGSLDQKRSRRRTRG